jgi:adenosylcobinamide-GDP ribazoletransferase
MKYLRLAFSLLTILPIGSLSEAPKPGDSGKAAIWFPWVGLVIGSVTAGGWWLFHQIFPPLVTSILTLALWVILTGGLHLDGLADCCDGLLSTASPLRRLEIMADSRLGSFAVIGLILVLLLKLALINSLPASSLPFVFIFACVYSRWLVLLAGRQPAAQPDGMAVDFSSGLTNASILWGSVLPVVLLVFGGWQAALAAATASLTAVGIITFARSRINGVTGDVFGLTIEVAELMVLLTYAAY